ncbi:MAG: hypothetical protein RLO38_16010 [Roseovarius confluentis]|uniref:hypothetical protein n=1 Tax=Roseovarius sp. TaxID=1486281 RepID=UPI0032EEAF17
MASTNPQWLEDELARGVRERWCMRRGCTTCGSYQMIELLTGATVSGSASLRQALGSMTWMRAEEVVDGLRNCGSQTSADGIMWILFMLWQRWGERVHEDLFPALAGTYAGDVLSGMRAHYARTQERRRLHFLRQGVKKKDWLE